VGTLKKKKRKKSPAVIEMGSDVKIGRELVARISWDPCLLIIALYAPNIIMEEAET
jgi:hypothetical protein